MYEYVLFKTVVLGWPIIKVVLIAGVALYTCSKVLTAISKRMGIKKAKKKVNVNEKDDNGQTQLMNVESLKEAQILVERGIDINAVDNKGNNAAMYIENDKILSFLIENGIDINAINKDGKNALMLNAIRGNDKNMELLMKNGADKTLTDNQGKSVLQHYLENAINEERGASSKIPEGCVIINADIVKSLLEEPGGLDSHKKTKKIMSLQSIKGHKKMEDCQKKHSEKEEIRKEVMPTEQKKQTNLKAPKKNTIRNTTGKEM